ncbi:hypothetical protein MO867_07725 [Microbulbifer sp. OS29]|uniref:Uncharacterized protein n=1 Tax=Microbulbifer okhotskensis TaxID=2926617 RepID=A0A9X2J794_9GAMM|nr:hypothetical protein [Microbulbifer okhotskensis]MCO1334231.1 hypothetical protein [Microbulbifer okhotskensis]
MFDNKFDCPKIHNSLTCARAIEDRLLEELIFVSRTKPFQLALTLKNGETKVYTDFLVKDRPTKNQAFSALEQINDSFLLIHRQLWEASSYILLDLDSGIEYLLSGYPLLSPQGIYLLVAEQDLDAGFNKNILKVYYLAGKFPKIIFEIEPENWGPDRVRWTTENTVEFSKKQFNSNYNQAEGSTLFLGTKALLSINSDNRDVTLQDLD